MRKQIILEELRRLRDAGQFVAGTQVNEYEVRLKCDSMDRLVALTGKEQGLLGLELMFANEHSGYETGLIDHAIEHTSRGGLVTLTWHMRNPLRVCARGEFFECSKTPMSPASMERMLQPGTAENQLWLADLDSAAASLKKLQAAGIIVLFRPFHEMNGDWFWWGRQPQYPALWDALYDRLATHHQLHNLIWVWAGDRAVADAPRYWPQRHAPDVVGTDVYEADPSSPAYFAAKANIAPLASRQPFALTEVGKLPAPDVLAELKPAWVLLWGGEFINRDWTAGSKPCPTCNSADETARFFAQPGVVSLSQMSDRLRRAVLPPSQKGKAKIVARPHCPSTLLP